MLNDDCVGRTHYHAGGYLALIHGAGIRTGGSLDIYAFVVQCYVFVYMVLVLAVMSTDKSCCHRPWHASFVGGKTSGNQFLLLGQLLLAIHLFGNSLLDLLVQLVDLLLLLSLFGGKFFLFLLQVLQHCFLFALVTGELVALALLGLQGIVFLLTVVLNQFRLNLNVRFHVLDALHLLLPVGCELAHIPQAAHQLIKILGG